MSIRVLLVDDEVEFLETLSKRLARREIEAFTAIDCCQNLKVVAFEIPREHVTGLLGIIHHQDGSLFCGFCHGKILSP